MPIIKPKSMKENNLEEQIERRYKNNGKIKFL